MKQRTLPAIAIVLGILAVVTTVLAQSGGIKGKTTKEFGTPPGPRASMLVPFSAGGGSDMSGRAVAAGLEEVTGIQFTTENIEGGSGAIGYANFIGRKGDASSLLPAETALVALPIVQKVPFNYDSFTPIMKVGDDYTLIVVTPDAKWNTCRELVDEAKKKDILVGVSGATSLDEIVFALIEADQKVKFSRIPYESGGEVLSGLLGKHIQVASLNPAEVIGQLESKELKPLCAVAPKRYTYPALKGIPTAIEQGIQVDVAQFRSFIAPADISPADRDYWLKAGKAYSKTKGYKEYIAQNYLQDNILYGEDFRKYLDKYHHDLEIALGGKK